MAGAHQIGSSDYVCNPHEYRCLRSISDADGYDGRIYVQLADRHDVRTRGVASGFDDVCAVIGLLHPSTGQETRKTDRSAPYYGVHGMVRENCKNRDGPSL